MDIDQVMYPDMEPPDTLETLEDKADYLHRVASAFDFGVPPELATIQLLQGWKAVFDAFPLPHSPAYHAFRAYFGWEPVPSTKYFGDPGYLILDAAEGRTDGFEDRV